MALKKPKFRMEHLEESLNEKLFPTLLFWVATNVFCVSMRRLNSSGWSPEFAQHYVHWDTLNFSFGVLNRQPGSGKKYYSKSRHRYKVALRRLEEMNELERVPELDQEGQLLAYRLLAVGTQLPPSLETSPVSSPEANYAFSEPRPKYLCVLIPIQNNNTVVRNKSLGMRTDNSLLLNSDKGADPTPNVQDGLYDSRIGNVTSSGFKTSTDVQTNHIALELSHGSRSDADSEMTCTQHLINSEDGLSIENNVHSGQNLCPDKENFAGIKEGSEECGNEIIVQYDHLGKNINNKISCEDYSLDNVELKPPFTSIFGNPMISGLENSSKLVCFDNYFNFPDTVSELFASKAECVDNSTSSMETMNSLGDIDYSPSFVEGHDRFCDGLLQNVTALLPSYLLKQDQNYWKCPMADFTVCDM